jgi:hypothetical protein
MNRPLDADLFIRSMRGPRLLADLSPPELEQAVRYARRAGLLANLAARARAAAVEMPALADLFEGAEVYAAEYSRAIRWEMQQLGRLVAELECPVVVLKGGAYLGMGLPSAAGRLVSDLDLMVPQDHLERVEALMLANAYHSQKQDAYDQQYYREWMHELPPLVHAARGTVVDLHHNIAPPVSRLQIDAAKLFERAVPLAKGSPYLRLGDEDLVLHLCVHMFHDGELHNALRELFDLDAMLRRCGADDRFWVGLQERAREMGLLRPLYYGLRFSRRLLHTPVPDPVARSMQAHAPPPLLRGLLEWAMRRAILPERGERLSPLKAAAEQLLFLRAHWLRMPPGMLARHLWTQFRRRGGLKTAEQATAAKGAGGGRA